MAGKIGCHYDNIEITSVDSNLGLSDPVYRAQCAGTSKQYVCSLNRNSDELYCSRTASLRNYPMELYGENDQGFEDFINGLNQKASKQ